MHACIHKYVRACVFLLAFALHPGGSFLLSPCHPQTLRYLLPSLQFAPRTRLNCSPAPAPIPIPVPTPSPCCSFRGPSLPLCRSTFVRVPCPLEAATRRRAPRFRGCPKTSQRGPRDVPVPLGAEGRDHLQDSVGARARQNESAIYIRRTIRFCCNRSTFATAWRVQVSVL